MKILSLFLFPFLLLKCNTDISKDFNMIITNRDKKFINSDTLEIKIFNRENHPIDSICYLLNEKRIPKKFPLIDFKLGIHPLKVSVYCKGVKFEYKA